MTAREGEEEIHTDRPPDTLFSDTVTRETPTPTSSVAEKSARETNNQQHAVGNGSSTRYRRDELAGPQTDKSSSSSERSQSTDRVPNIDLNRQVSIGEAQPTTNHEDLELDLMHTPSRGSENTAAIIQAGPSNSQNIYSANNRSPNRHDVGGIINPLEGHHLAETNTTTSMSTSPTNAARATDDANRRVPEADIVEDRAAFGTGNATPTPEGAGTALIIPNTMSGNPPRATSPRTVTPRAAGGAAAGPPNNTNNSNGGGYVNPHPNTTSSGRPRVPNSEIMSRSKVTYHQPLKTRQAILLDSHWMSDRVTMRCFEPRHIFRNRCDIVNHCQVYYNDDEDCCRCLVVDRPKLFLCLLCSLDIITVGCPCGMCYHGCGTTMFGCWSRWMVRRRYRIEGFGWSDCLMMMCCVGCATAQMQYEIDHNMTYALSAPAHDTEMR